MGRELRYFFMNPIQKYKARKRIPFKLIIQVIKIILVTVQVCSNYSIIFLRFYQVYILGDLIWKFKPKFYRVC